MTLVASAHGLVVLAIGAGALFGSCAMRKAPVEIPLQLVVEIPVEASLTDAGREPPTPPAPKPPEPPAPKPPAPPKEPETAIVPEMRVKPPEKPPEPRRRPPVERSNKLVQRTPVKAPPPKQKTTLTPDEIRRLLERGARPSETASLSDDDLRRVLQSDLALSDRGTLLEQDTLYFELIRKAMYQAWNQPASVAVQGMVTRVTLSLREDGTITGYRLAQGSGNAVMDQSVLQAVQAVPRITGLPASFIGRHRSITVAFELSDR